MPVSLLQAVFYFDAAFGEQCFIVPCPQRVLARAVCDALWLVNGMTDSQMCMGKGVTFWAVQQASHPPRAQGVLSSVGTHRQASTGSKGSNTAAHASPPCTPPDAQGSTNSLPCSAIPGGTDSCGLVAHVPAWPSAIQ